MNELENVQQNQTVFQDTSLKEKIANPVELLEKSINKLAKLGGFDLLESNIEGVQNLNPEKKARKKIFLTDKERKAEREALKNSLNLWIDLLSDNADVDQLIETAHTKSDAADLALKDNLNIALAATRELEASYRSIALFYSNTEGDRIKNVSFVNADLEQLKDLDNTIFIDAIADELKQNFDRLDLRNNYSIMVIPGYLGSNKVVEKWAKIAFANKVMLVTDFEDLEGSDDVIEMFESANLTGGEIYRSNVMMTCNWLVGRGKVAEVGEDDDLFVPPSGALAGKVYKTLMSQVTAGKKFGGMNDVDGVKFDLKKSEIANLEKIGLIPMVNEYGKVMAFSAKTLFNGDNMGLQTYSVVRVFDYITKVLIDFLNRRAFENFTTKTERDLRGQIIRFLDTVRGPDKLIENFKIMRFEQDKQKKDKIHLDIHLTPYFPAKSFMIKMDGQKGEEAQGVEWSTEYAKQ